MLLGFFRLIGKIFFREIVIEGRENLPASGPLILASNHPNDLLDPLLTLFFSPPFRLRHIAKSTLFLVPLIGFILRRMRAIPVLRHKEAQGPIDYSSFFDECVGALAEGDAIVIFPEGGSSETPYIGPLKTGAARMYFLARQRGLDVPIIPVGINYEEGSIFRSSVLLLVAKPVDCSRFEALHASDPAAAIQELTTEIHRVLGDHVFQAETFQDRELIILLERVYFESQRGHDWAERYRRLGEFKPRVTELRHCCSQEMVRLRRLVARYRRLVRLVGMRTGEIPATPMAAILGATGSLLAYAGWIFNWIPYRLVQMARRAPASPAHGHRHDDDHLVPRRLPACLPRRRAPHCEPVRMGGGPRLRGRHHAVQLPRSALLRVERNPGHPAALPCGPFPRPLVAPHIAAPAAAPGEDHEGGGRVPRHPVKMSFSLNRVFGILFTERD